MRLRRGVVWLLPLLAALLGGLWWLGQSWWLGRGLEAGLGALLRTPVEVQGARLDPFTLEARVARIRIADRDDPGRWAFEGGPAEMTLAFWPLLEGKWVIETLRLEGVDGGTPRQAPPSPAPAAAPDAPPADEAQLLTELRAALPRLDLGLLAQRLDVDALLADRPLATLAWAEAQGERWRRQWTHLGETLATLEQEVPTALARLQARLAALEGPVVDVAALRQRLAELVALRDELRALRERLQQARAQLEEMDFGIDEAGLAAAREEDLALLERLGGLRLAQVADALFGAPVSRYVATTVAALGQLRGLLASEDEPPPPPPRRAGREFVFPADPPVPPRFLLRTGHLSGRWPGRGAFALDLQDLSSAPADWAAPVRFRLRLGEGAPWHLQGTLDHRRGRDEDRLQLAGEGLRLGPWRLGTPAGQPLPEAVTLDRSRVEGALTQRDGRLEGRLRLEAAQVRFRFPEAVDPAYAEAAGALRRLFVEETARLTLEVQVTGTLARPRLRLASSLDEALSARLQALLGARLAAARAALAERLEAQVQARLKALRAPLEAERAALAERLEAWGAEEAALQARLEALEARLQRRLRERLEAAGEAAKQRLREELRRGLKGLGL